MCVRNLPINQLEGKKRGKTEGKNEVVEKKSGKRKQMKKKGP